MTVKNIMISNIKPEYTAMYIANVLNTREIAQVTSITLIPEIKNGEIFNIAYIDIDTYCDTEAAYEFIENIKSGFFVLYHDFEDKPWVFQKNTHNLGGLFVGTYTTNFYYHENENLQEIEEQIHDFDTELRIEYAISNSHNVTLRPHQFLEKKNQETQKFPREMIWRSEMCRSVSDLSV
jgi:hypothetical protein